MYLQKKRNRNGLSQAEGITLGSDAFFPFSDNIERAAKSGVKYVAQPGGLSVTRMLLMPAINMEWLWHLQELDYSITKINMLTFCVLYGFTHIFLIECLSRCF